MLRVERDGFQIESTDEIFIWGNEETNVSEDGFVSARFLQNSDERLKDDGAVEMQDAIFFFTIFAIKNLSQMISAKVLLFNK